MMLRDRITVRMALRNFTRGKTNMALVIEGLRIGTAMISGSLVTGDPLTELFTRGAYFGYGHADEVVYARNSTTVGFQGSAYQYFGYNVYQSLSTGLSNNPSAGPDVVGVTPEIIETVSLYDTNKGIVQAGSALIGTFSNASRVLGDFHSASGSVIPSTFSNTEAVLNDKAARDLNATIGDTLTVYSAQRLTTQHLNFTVVGIAASDERGSFTQGDDVFVTLSIAQQFTGHLNSVNYIAITNIGGLRGSIQYSQAVAQVANQTLNNLYSTTPSTTTSTSTGCKTDPSMAATPPAIPCAFTEKKISVDNATSGAKQLSMFFLILSSFAILAGIVLILNIFIMLAEERKSEMGMARAVGMRRGQLTKLFLFEGSLYSAGASIVGVLVGIGVAYGILYAIGNIFSSFITGLNESLVLSSFTVSPESLVTAFTLSGFGLLVQWAVPSLSFDSPLVSNYSFGPEVFIVGGIIMVVAAVMVVMYNVDPPLKALRFLLRKRRTLTAIFKIALSYPENKRFRTAATVAMFALVLFTVSAVASIQAELNASITQSAKDQSGGYDIATNTAPLANLTSSVMADTTLSSKVSAVIPFSTVLLDVAHDSSTSQDFPYTLLVGADPNAPETDNFFTTNSFKMLSLAAGYVSATEVWNAVRSNESYVVWSVSFAGNVHPNPGDNLVLAARPAGNLVLKSVKVLGVLRGLFDGILGVRGLLKDSFNVDSGTLGLVNVAKGLDPVNVANLLKKDFIQLGMQTIVIEVSIEQGERIFLSFFGLFEGYLALGLVVGVAGVGIISIRSVVERRNEIGILRALGFRKRMVMLAFLVESSYIALLGIIIGVSLGVDLAYAFTAQPNSGLSFVIPWTQIIEISVVSYALAMLSVISSARKASRIPPAEALRYTE